MVKESLSFNTPELRFLFAAKKITTLTAKSTTTTSAKFQKTILYYFDLKQNFSAPLPPPVFINFESVLNQR
jgi:hypothetical protein